MKCSLGISNFLEEISAAAAKSLQSCLTLSDLMDCSLPGSSVHGIFQARVLEWGAIAFSGSVYDNCLIPVPSLKRKRSKGRKGKELKKNFLSLEMEIIVLVSNLSGPIV